MAGHSDLDQFDIDIRRDDDTVIAAIPAIGLFARGDTEQAARAALEEKKQLLESDLEAFRNLKPEGVYRSSSTDLAEAPSALRGRSSIGGWQAEVRSFAIKAAIVFLLAIAGLTYGTIQIQQMAESSLRQLEIRGGKSFWGNLEAELARAADPANALPTEQKRRLLSQIRRLVDEYRPFVTEVTAIFIPEGQARSQTGTATGASGTTQDQPAQPPADPEPSPAPATAP